MNGRQLVTFQAGMGSAHERASARDLWRVWAAPMNGRQPVTFQAGMGRAHERASARDLSGGYGQSA